MALRVASDAKVTKPWPKALEEARGILAKDCGAECLRILDTVVAPALNGTQREQAFLCLVDESPLGFFRGMLVVSWQDDSFALCRVTWR